MSFIEYTISNSPVYGSFGGAGISPSGHIFATVWHSGALSQTAETKRHIVEVFKPEAGYVNGDVTNISYSGGQNNPIFPGDGEYSENPHTIIPQDFLGSSTNEWNLMQSLANFSSISFTKPIRANSSYTAVVVPYWTFLPPVIISMHGSNSVNVYSMDGIRGKSYLYRNPTDSDVDQRPYWFPLRTFYNDYLHENDLGVLGSFYTSTTLPDGRILMTPSYFPGTATATHYKKALNQSFNTSISEEKRGIIYDPKYNKWYFTQADVCDGTFNRVQQLLLDGRVYTPASSTSTGTVYDSVSDTSTKLPDWFDDSYSRTCCLNPLSGFVYSTGRTRLDRPEKSHLAVFNPQSRTLEHTEASTDINTFYAYNSMQPLPSSSPDIDVMILIPGDEPTVTKPRIVEYNKVSKVVNTYEIDDNIGYGYSCSVYDYNGNIWCFPSSHDQTLKILTPPQAYVWDKRIVEHPIMDDK